MKIIYKTSQFSSEKVVENHLAKQRDWNGVPLKLICQTFLDCWEEPRLCMRAMLFVDCLTHGYSKESCNDLAEESTRKFGIKPLVSYTVWLSNYLPYFEVDIVDAHHQRCRLLQGEYDCRNTKKMWTAQVYSQLHAFIPSKPQYSGLRLKLPGPSKLDLSEESGLWLIFFSIWCTVVIYMTVDVTFHHYNT